MMSTSYEEDDDSDTVEERLPMLIVMGVTGSGKSYLINKIAGKKVVREGESLESCTETCAVIPVEIGRTKALIIDTPGFDDTKRANSDILNEIARLLAAQYELGFELKGIIYTHRITDIRYSGSAITTFEILKRICGPDTLQNVLLMTSGWDQVDEPTGASRERQLRKDFWAYMLAHGSHMARYHGDRDSAISLASQLLVRDSVVLQLQDEMVNGGKQLHQTAAGSYVDGGIEKMRREVQSELEALERQRQTNAGYDRMLVEEDWRKKKQLLQKAEREQVCLRRDVAAAVKQGIRREEEKVEEVNAAAGENRRRRVIILGKLIVPAALGILGMFIETPPEALETAARWAMTAFSGVVENFLDG